MILTMVAMLSMTAAFAEGEKTAEVSNLEAYELNINMNKLSKALGLYDDQKEAVEEIHHTFAAELSIRCVLIWSFSMSLRRIVVSSSRL